MKCVAHGNFNCQLCGADWWWKRGLPTTLGPKFGGNPSGLFGWLIFIGIFVGVGWFYYQSLSTSSGNADGVTSDGSGPRHWVTICGESKPPRLSVRLWKELYLRDVMTQVLTDPEYSEDVFNYIEAYVDLNSGQPFTELVFFDSAAGVKICQFKAGYVGVSGAFTEAFERR